MSSRTGTVVAIVLATLFLGATGYTLIMTAFMVYDDEGFVLMTLRQFLGGEILYDEVFSQYGPAPYVYHWFLTAGGAIELTHFFGRCLTLIHWLVCAGCSGWMASRLVDHHRLFTGGFTALLTFGLLWQMIAEPTHPGSLIAATLAAGTTIALRAVEMKQPALLALAAGLTGIVLFLTKINVGVFFIAGVGAFALTHSNLPRRWQPSARALAGLGLATSPWLLMASNLQEPRMLMLALKASSVGFGLWWIIRATETKPVLEPRHGILVVSSFLAGGIVIVGLVMLRGTSGEELVAAVAIDPLRQPGNFTVPPTSSWASLLFAAVTITAVVWAGLDLSRQGQLGTGCFRLVAVLRISALAALIGFALRWPSPWGAFTLLDYVLPLLVLASIPHNRTDHHLDAKVAWLSLIAVFQVLHAYPVAGSQIGWGCFLAVPLIAASMVKTWQGLTPALSTVPRRAGWAVLGLAAFAGPATMAQEGWQRYQSCRPLPFAGTVDLRLDDRTRVALTALVQNASVHADTLFSRQGMYSFNIWSETPPPSSRNATHWFWLLDESEQQEIIQRLDGDARAAFIVSVPLDELLAQLNVPVQGPLQDYAESNFTQALRLGGYSFRVKPARVIAPLGLAEVFVSPDTASAPVMLRATSLLPEMPARAELVEIEASGNFGAVIAASERGQTTRIRRDGSPVSEPADWSDRTGPAGIYHLTFFAPTSTNPRDYTKTALVFRNPAGEVIAEALFE